MIAPSLLSAEFSALGEAASLAERGGADLIHVDVMDGHFVPPITFGSAVVKSLKKSTTLPLDVHLMVSNPWEQAEQFLEAGADMISFHIEATPHPYVIYQRVRKAGRRVGISLNPMTPAEAIRDSLPYVDFVLVMSVSPGYGGQPFIPETLGKIETIRKWVEDRGLTVPIEVDGGVTSKTIPSLKEAGAEIFVAGSAIFGAPDPMEALKTLKELTQ